MRDQKPYLKYGTTEIVSHTDPETGEIITDEIKSNAFVATSKEEFYLFYTRVLSAFYELNGRDIKVFSFLLQNFGTSGTFGIPKVVKEEACQKTGVTSTQSVMQSILVLCKQGLLIRKGRGAYQINPAYVFKGSSTSRKAVIEILLKENYSL